MSKLVITLFVFSFFSAELIAQELIVGKVTSKETGLPVPYATVTILRDSLSSQTDLQGQFQISRPVGSKQDTIRFSAVGYTSLKLILKANTKRIDVILKEDVKTLKEVKIGDSKPKKLGTHLGGHPTTGTTITQIAKRFEMPSGYSVLRSVTVRRAPLFNDLNPNTRFRIRIYNQDLQKGCPGHDIFPKTIEIEDVNQDQIEIDLAKYNIVIDSKIFFVAIEKLLIPFNERYYLFISNSSLDTYNLARYQIHYQPILYMSVSGKSDCWSQHIGHVVWKKSPGNYSISATVL